MVSIYSSLLRMDVCADSEPQSDCMSRGFARATVSSEAIGTVRHKRRAHRFPLLSKWSSGIFIDMSVFVSFAQHSVF